MAIRNLYTSSPDWAAIGEQMDELLAGPNFRILKKTSRALAGIARAGGTEVFVKRVENGSFCGGVIARLGGSPARKTLWAADSLDEAGLNHPRLLAIFEKRTWGAVRASYILVERLHRPKTLSRFALADGRDVAWRRWFSECLARTIRRLHDTGCYTLDLQETNLMVEAQGDDLKVYFIDLEDFRRLRVVPQRFRLLNLVHLDRSIGRFVSRAHRVRFLYNYLGGRPGRGDARAIIAQLRQIRERIERRKSRQQQATAIIPPWEERRRVGEFLRSP
jgi:tRNA A-37 threonylcarbamoyl transferase component Bud32